MQELTEDFLRSRETGVVLIPNISEEPQYRNNPSIFFAYRNKMMFVKNKEERHKIKISDIEEVLDPINMWLYGRFTLLELGPDHFDFYVRKAFHICTKCKGIGKLEYQNKEDQLVVPCSYCSSTGYMSTVEKTTAETNDDEWCKCPEPTPDAQYYNTGEHNIISTKHWRCSSCSKVQELV
jgi:hypothetical protein